MCMFVNMCVYGCMCVCEYVCVCVYMMCLCVPLKKQPSLLVVMSCIPYIGEWALFALGSYKVRVSVVYLGNWSWVTGSFHFLVQEES